MTVEDRSQRGMRIAMVCAILVVLLTSVMDRGVPAAQPAGEPVPVLLELFTSEGCSSCPPADHLLAALAKQQPIAGARIIPLELHVDYWDDLGWKDPASSAAATRRQQSYGRVFGEDRVYTPQMVVDGRDEFVGSDASEARRVIARALKQPHARVTLRSAIENGTVAATATITELPAQARREPLEGVFAVTEDDLVTIVQRGENGGRTLEHDAVVRQLVSLGDVKEGAELTPHVPLQPAWSKARLNAVVFVQGRKSHRIWGAATVRLPR
jgi:hypothetical protein